MLFDRFIGVCYGWNYFVVVVVLGKWIYILMLMGVRVFSKGVINMEGEDEKEVCGVGLEFERKVWVYDVNIFKYEWRLIFIFVCWKGVGLTIF